MFSDPAIDFGEEMCAAKGTTGGERKADQTKENAENQTRPKRKEKKRSRPNKR